MWTALDSMSEMGNIGAHMEADVNLIVEIEPEEAHFLMFGYFALTFSCFYHCLNLRQIRLYMCIIPF